MKSYKALRAQIAKLEQQAEALRQTQVKAVVAQLKKSIAEYGLTAEELGLVPGAPGARGMRRAAKPAAKRPAGSGVAKYRDPKTGQTWTGRGRPPAWIVGAKDRDAFLIAQAPAAEAPAPAAPRRTKAGKVAKAAKAPAKRAAPRKAAAKKARRARAATKSPAVQIEGGVAME